MEVLQTFCAACAVVAVVGIIAWGVNSCSLQETALREACIKAGGSAVSDGRSFRCLRLGAGAPER